MDKTLSGEPVPLGLSHRCAGYRQRYDAVFLLNQDAWMAPDSIGFLAAQAEKHPEYGILSPVHLNGTGNRLDHGFASYVHQTDPARIPHDQDVIEAPFINAAFWFIPVRTLNRPSSTIMAKTRTT